MKLIGTTGKPASGKTVTAKKIAEQLDCPIFEMGDIVTERVSKYVGKSKSSLTSDEKGTAATELREEYGETVFAEATLEKALNCGSEYVVVSGIRTPEEINVFDSGSDFTLVLVEADFETRYQRFVSRGREDEGDFTRNDFEKRNEREMNWGLDKVLSEELYDVSIQNASSVDVLTSKVSDFVKTVQ